MASVNYPLTSQYRTSNGSLREAYFSMEIAIDPAIPTYSGGLGVLAGDTIRSAADLELPLVGVTLLHREGYFRQSLNGEGQQQELPDEWDPAPRLERLDAKARVSIEGREVVIRPWRYVCRGNSGHEVSVYLLDTDLAENDPYDRALTSHLYGGDSRYRLCQETVLGMGGIATLQALGHSDIRVFHMNEGHSALLVLGLLKQIHGSLSGVALDDIDAVRRRCVFTTHTPVPAGHDQFSRDLMRQVLGVEAAQVLDVTKCCPDDLLNMTFLALRCSHFVNGVAMRHGEVSQGMFPNYPIRAITNGVHAQTWVSPPFGALFDELVPGWRRDNLNLRYVMKTPLDRIRATHLEAKRALIDRLGAQARADFDETVFTIGFARRATAYKRADLVFHDLDRLRWIARNSGPFQIVMGGKAHPRDEGGKELIRRIYEAARALDPLIRVVYVENYDVDWAKALCSGVDLWLNTPKRPHEASGTSGMKAAMNGVPSLSVLDGWWVEGHIENVTGWSIGDDDAPESDDEEDAAALYDKLGGVILPQFYGQRDDYTKVMRSAIALNGSYFNTQRMVFQYSVDAYAEQPSTMR